ncbi:hypothetical protein PHLGIDRAFT_18100 [Phlebiopsis gigantea 11061_1 CR5-6]|uniref:Uncharacterized protein n=1 Tax=Phlebiopsis gigantea (strain 11061_1 CR5-6) TaxID=745531 RepID=A0A0C3PU89_PHLG1|nr:hypothetical protein PHLGIDRAFT_18100 [Phlebiopsis gigantea 11061_1 CR5-6]
MPHHNVPPSVPVPIPAPHSSTSRIFSSLASHDLYPFPSLVAASCITVPVPYSSNTTHIFLLRTSITTRGHTTKRPEVFYRA